MTASPLIVVDATLALVAWAAYAYVGRVIQLRRMPTADARGANLAFAMFWYSLAGLAAIDVVRAALGYAGILDVDLHVTLRYLTLPLIMTMLASLVYYLVYVHTGNTRWRLPILLFHAALFVLYTYIVVWVHPYAVDAEGWQVELVDERRLGGAALAFVLVTLLVPALFAAGAYLTLYVRTADRHARFRILLVSTAFIVWFGSALVASAIGIADRYDWWPLVSRGLGLVAALLVVVAFRPPSWLASRLGPTARTAP